MVFATAEASGLSLVAAASWGGGDFCGGLAAKRASVFRVVAVAHGCGLIAMLAMAWLTGEAIPPPADLEWGAFAGLVGAFGIGHSTKRSRLGEWGWWRQWPPSSPESCRCWSAFAPKGCLTGFSCS